MQQRFEGSLTERDQKTHVLHAFDVEPGTTCLTVRLHYDSPPASRLRNMLCLTLFDPGGFRGAGHRGGGAQVVTVEAARATPGYLAGPIEPGRWVVVIDAHRVVREAPCTYRIEVETSDAAPDQVVPQPEVRAVAPRGAGWYRGDLHAHTVHSDGSWSIADLLAAARDRGLDFVTLTDHNTVSHLVGIDSLSSDDLLVMGGMELTTFWGHALSLGTRRWIDWRAGPQRTMPQIACEVHDAGGVFVIAHPTSPGDPVCTGCDWRYVEMTPGPARCVEVWNGPWDGSSNNEQALLLYYEWLNRGDQLVATAGTDAHGPAAAAVRPGFNVVYASERSETAILRAIQQGRLYLSSGPQVSFTAHGAGGATAMVGDTLHAAPELLRTHWADGPVQGVVRLIADGAAVDQLSIGPQGEHSWRVANAARWYLVEIRDAAGVLVAVTNPIFTRHAA